MKTLEFADENEIAALNAEPWMLDCLRMNPSYVHWGPGDDYMHGRGDGWDSGQSMATWEEFGPWHLDELNEVVHFYFHATRSSVECQSCGGSGHNPETRAIEEDFYDLRGDGSRRWCNKITQDEVDALVAQGRLQRRREGGPLTADEVNAANSARGSLFGALSHDAINRWILVEARALRLGVFGQCTECGGEGSVYTSPAATLGLVLWFLHPRKGASRGVEIQCIQRDELPAVFAFLREAARRNAERFQKVIDAAVTVQHEKSA